MTPDADSLPADWSDAARATYTRIVEDHPDLDASTLATLHQACALEAAADRCDARVAEDGQMIAGSSGQQVAHPLIAEARQARAAAIAALRALGLASGQSPASRAGASLARKRWDGRSHKRAAVVPLASTRDDLERRLERRLG